MSTWQEELDRAVRSRPRAVQRAARRVFKNRASVLERLARLSPEQLKAVADDVQLGLALLRDAGSGRLPVVPWRTVAAVAFALGYLALSLDAIPDFLPVVGLTDDLAVLGYVWSAFRHDLQRYRRWREQQGEEIIEADG